MKNNPTDEEILDLTEELAGIENTCQLFGEERIDLKRRAAIESELLAAGVLQKNEDDNYEFVETHRLYSEIMATMKSAMGR